MIGSCSSSTKTPMTLSVAVNDVALSAESQFFELDLTKRSFAP